ncbi:MAG: phage portal protein [Agarilytica sp.]
MPEILDQFGAPMSSDMRAYEAAEFGRELAEWSPTLSSADSDIAYEKDTLDARSLDAARNDGYVVGGRNIHADNIVGDQFKLSAKPNVTLLQRVDSRLDREWAQEFSSVAEARFGLWAESPDCYVDVRRKRTFTELVRASYLSVFDAGDSLATFEWHKNAGPNKTQVRLVETSRLSNPYGQQDSLTLRQGIKLNRHGAEMGYHIRRAQTGDAFDPANIHTWDYVPRYKRWGRLNASYIALLDRPEQTRAVGELVSILKTIKSCKKFRDIQLERAALNAMYAATLETDLPPQAAFEKVGVDVVKNGVQGEEQVPWPNYYARQVANYNKAAGNLRFNGVKMPALPPGTKLKLNTANGIDSVGSDFEVSMLRYLSSALKLPYEQFARDFTQTSYSSARFSSIDTWKFFATRKRMVPAKFATQIYTAWLEEEMSLNRLPMPANAPSYWDQKDAYAGCGWVGAGRGQIDPVKETQGSAMRLGLNMSTLEKECANYDGSDWQEVLLQKAREKEYMNELGITENDIKIKGISNTSDADQQKQMPQSKESAESFSLEINPLPKTA